MMASLFFVLPFGVWHAQFLWMAAFHKIITAWNITTITRVERFWCSIILSKPALWKYWFFACFQWANVKNFAKCMTRNAKAIFFRIQSIPCCVNINDNRAARLITHILFLLNSYRKKNSPNRHFYIWFNYLVYNILVTNHRFHK